MSYSSVSRLPLAFPFAGVESAVGQLVGDLQRAGVCANLLWSY